MNEMYALNGVLISLIKMDFCDEKEARALLRAYMDNFPHVRRALLMESYSEKRFSKVDGGFSKIEFYFTFGPV